MQRIITTKYLFQTVPRNKFQSIAQILDEWREEMAIKECIERLEKEWEGK